MKYSINKNIVTLLLASGINYASSLPSLFPSVRICAEWDLFVIKSNFRIGKLLEIVTQYVFEK